MQEEPRITKKKYKTIDRNLVFRLACIQCSDVEIAEAVGISTEVLKKRFNKVIEQGRHEGRQSLRSAMYSKAIEGSERLQIFLSKQYLGMRDTPEDGDAKAPLPWED
jgi:hypothetical protein|tara:strand:+ start:2752 stop:3072 length:321 start_codon:yes stop_codon:yes gene_type:complete